MNMKEMVEHTLPVAKKEIGAVKGVYNVFTHKQ